MANTKRSFTAFNRIIRLPEDRILTSEPSRAMSSSTSIMISEPDGLTLPFRMADHTMNSWTIKATSLIDIVNLIMPIRVQCGCRVLSRHSVSSPSRSDYLPLPNNRPL